MNRLIPEPQIQKIKITADKKSSKSNAKSANIIDVEGNDGK